MFCLGNKIMMERMLKNEDNKVFNHKYFPLREKRKEKKERIDQE